MITWLNTGFGIVILLLGLLMINGMTRGTQCGVRWGVVLITVGGFFAALGNVWKWEAWADTALLGGLATYMLANLRTPLSAPTTSWGRRGAYVAASATVLALILAWGTPARGQEPEASAEEPLKFGVSPNFEKAQDEIKRMHGFCVRSGGCTILSKQDALNLQATLNTLKAHVSGLEKRIAYCEERNFYSIRIVPARVYINDGVRGPNDFGGWR